MSDDGQTAASGPSQGEIDQLATAFSAGRFGEAEACAAHMVQAWPHHWLGWKALGATLAAQQRQAEALPVLQKALALSPSDVELHNKLGNVLSDLGRTPEAQASYRRAIELNPDYHEAYNNLGNALLGSGQLDEAARCFRRAIELKPDYPLAHNNLGNALQGLGQFDEAARSYRRALELKPDFHQAHDNLANALQQLGHALGQLGQLDEAVLRYRRALELKPGSYEAHNNLGNVLKDQWRLSEAEASYRRSLEINPDYYGAHCNLGSVLQALGRLTEAEISCRRAAELKPDYELAHNNLGNALMSLGRLAEAEASYRRALELRPEYSEAHNNLGNVLQPLGRMSEARASFDRALELKPDFHEAHSNLIFTLDLLEDCGIGEQQAERQRWYQRHGRRHGGAIKPHDNARDPERSLRIGFVSADFRRHSAYYGFSPIILYHNRDAFELVCYSGVKLEDDATARLRQAAHEWRSTLGVSDEALAEQIRRDRIDILVDLSGHSAGNRLTVFARKPAPIQVTGWGFAGGTGLATMDYYASDAVVVPEGERGLYAEEVIYLPCGACYEAPEYAPAVSGLPALESEVFTFGCVNRIEKISERVIALWGRLLAQLPEARLLIKGGGLNDLENRQHFLRRLRDAGIGAERLSLMGISPHREHLKIYHEVDLGLDPYPHGGGISTAEALWMGVPVVALAGASITSRITPSILTALKMPEWIAQSDEEYVRIAVQAARDLPGLARLRRELRSRLAASTLGDVQRYTQEVEAAFRLMWRRWCADTVHVPAGDRRRA